MFKGEVCRETTHLEEACWGVQLQVLPHINKVGDVEDVYQPSSRGADSGCICSWVLRLNWFGLTLLAEEKVGMPILIRLRHCIKEHLVAQTYNTMVEISIEIVG